jgi:preprotein translocase subunit SecG
MYTLLIALSIIISVVLVIAVLLQSSKGAGLAGSIGGGAQLGTTFGTRRTADFLSRATWWLGGSLLVLAIVINLFFLPVERTGQGRESIIQGSGQSVPTQSTVPQQNTPTLPTE